MYIYMTLDEVRQSGKFNITSIAIDRKRTATGRL